MIHPSVLSLDAATGATYLNHSIAGATYSAAPAAATDGVRVRNTRGGMFDAIEFIYSYDATADATTTATVRPWFFVPDHDPSGAGGSWLAGKLIDNVVAAEFSTDVNAPVIRINSVPNAATRLYLQVVSIAGTAPTNLYMTIYGLEGNVADVAGDSGAGGGGGSSTTVVNSFDGSGVSTYQSPEDFTATYNNATTLDLTELPFAPVIEQFRQVTVFDTDYNVKATYDVEPPEDWTWTPGADKSSGSLEITGANFAATDLFVVTIRGPVKPYLELMADMAGSGVHQSPRDFTAAYNNATTLDITGMDFDPDLAQIRGVVEQASDGRVTMTYHPRSYEFEWTAGAAGAGALVVNGASFQNTSNFIVFIEGTERGTIEAQTDPSLTTRVWPTTPLGRNADLLRNTIATSGGTYSTSQLDCSVVYTAPTQITITGLPGSLDTGNFVQVDQWDSSGKKISWKPEDYDFSWNDATGVLTVTGGTFAGTDIFYDAWFNYTPKGYDPVGNQFYHWVNNQDPQQNTSSTLVDDSSITDGTYYYYVNMDEYRKVGFSIEITSGSGTVTVTIEGTLQDDDTAPASCYYFDCTFDAFNTSNITASDLWIDDAEKLAVFKYLRLKSVHATGGANDSGITVFIKQLY